jgi:hypothetical protein
MMCLSGPRNYAGNTLAGPLDQSQLAFKELVYGRLIRVFAGKNHGKVEIYTGEKMGTDR